MKERDLRVKVLATCFLIIIMSFYLFLKKTEAGKIDNIKIRSIDTMKFSRDLARAKLNDKSFDTVIDKHIKDIAGTNATHVAIGTPYDKEFLPFLKRWVGAARKYKLSVWFRGNLSGWEGWFEYPKIGKSEHTQNIENFIVQNRDLFRDGDIFTSCPECENGGRSVYEDPEGHKAFLIAEYNVVKKAFLRIDKKVTANYYSMNGDIARLIMDKKTTKALDGIVTIDHYVESVDQLVDDIREYAKNSGGKVVLGEIGAPIPDIHGKMTESAQRDWIASLFAKLESVDDLEGLNYWVSNGGSTSLWNPDGTERLAAEIVRNAYGDRELRAKLVDRKSNAIAGAKVLTLNEAYSVDAHGVFSVPYLYKGQIIEISAKGYPSKIPVEIGENASGEIVLDYNPPYFHFKFSLWDRIAQVIKYPITLLISLLTGKRN